MSQSALDIQHAIHSSPNDFKLKQTDKPVDHESNLQKCQCSRLYTSTLAFIIHLQNERCSNPRLAVKQDVLASITFAKKPNDIDWEENSKDVKKQKQPKIEVKHEVFEETSDNDAFNEAADNSDDNNTPEPHVKLEIKIEDKEKICSNCANVFPNLKSFKLHLKDNTECMRKKCLICGNIYRTTTYMNKHIVAKHNGDYPGLNKPKKFKCGVCEMAFISQRWLKYHSKTHLQVCYVCDRSVTNLSRHMQSHETSRNHIECELCKAKYLGKRNFDRHIVIKHDGVYPGLTQPKDYQCETCGLSFISKKFIEYHVWTHLEIKPPRKVEEIEQRTCKICDKVLANARNMRLHIKTHSDASKTPCIICGKLVIPDVMARHMKQMHSGPQEHKCPICDKVFKHSSNLSAHTSKHSEKRRTCSICNHLSVSYVALLLHKKKVHHIGGYSCEQCGKTFSFQKLLVKHSINCGKPKSAYRKKKDSKNEQEYEVEALEPWNYQCSEQEFSRSRAGVH